MNILGGVKNFIQKFSSTSHVSSEEQAAAPVDDVLKNQDPAYKVEISSEAADLIHQDPTKL